MKFPVNEQDSQAVRSRAKLLLAGPQSDCHVVGLKLLEFYLRERGFDVENLGVCTPNCEIAAAAYQLDPCAVLIGSQNGHGLKDVADLRDHMRALGVPENLPVFIGGNLSVGVDKNPERLRQAFTEIGIMVLQTFEEVEEAIAQLIKESVGQVPLADASH